MRLHPVFLLAALSATLPRGVPAQIAAPTPAGAQGFDWAALQREGVERLSEYLRINTSNPPGNELLTARWLRDLLAKEGIEGEILDTAELGPGRANFYARLKGTGAKKAIALVHHMDVVPVFPELWHVDAFAGTVKDGYVWGRGALDMKGHGIAQVMAVIALKRAGMMLDRDIVLIGNADEEVDGEGAITLVDRHRDLLADVEYLLTEGADTRVEGGAVRWFGINTGEKRPLWLRITAHGTTSHGSVPIGDQNPVPRLARAVARVAAWQTPVRLTPGVDGMFRARARLEGGEGRRWLADPAAALKNPRGRAWLLKEPERNALLRNTISPTVLTGSNKTNTIPEIASAELDIRLLPDEDPQAFKRELHQVIDDSTIRVEEITPLPPRYDAPIGTELYRQIERVVGQLLPGIPVAPDVSPGATDRPTYAQAGIICYGLDPYLIPIEENRYEVHGNDERLSEANLGWAIRFYTTLLTSNP
jgi:acetylornithine deacetylase/succinyl-diaminopimelate desuccinylase-like protein